MILNGGGGDGGCGAADEGVLVLKQEDTCNSVDGTVRNMECEYQSRSRLIKNECRQETYPMKCKAKENASNTLNRPSLQEMKRKRLLALSKPCDEVQEKNRKQRHKGTHRLTDLSQNKNLITADYLLKGSFLLRQKKKIESNVNGEIISKSKDETWDMVDNDKMLRPICGNSSCVENKCNIAPSKIVQSLANKHSMETIEWDNPVLGYSKTLEIPSLALTKSEKKFLKVDLSSQCMFSVEMLRLARIIGPVDKKYIACVIGSTNGEDIIVLIDQHAAHERIRLEHLIERVGYHSNMVFVSGQFTQLNPSLRIPVLEQERDFLVRYKKEFNGVGLNYSLSVSSRSCSLMVHSVPSIFVDGQSWKTEASCSSVNVEFLREFVLEQGNHMQATGSTCQMSSRMVFKALASYACHGAIKFGDQISLLRCKEIVKDLCKCKLPFQCAHGRPTIAPILRLSYLDGLLRKSRVKPDLAKLKKC